MVESRRIWFVTDDGANASCSKVSIIGINKEKLNKGQRLYVSPFKGDKAYCVFVEMTYFELFECFEKLISQKKDNTKDILHSHISSILTYIINNTSNPESQTTIKKLKRQIKNVISSTSQFLKTILTKNILNMNFQNRTQHLMTIIKNTPSQIVQRIILI